MLHLSGRKKKIGLGRFEPSTPRTPGSNHVEDGFALRTQDRPKGDGGHLIFCETLPTINGSR